MVREAGEKQKSLVFRAKIIFKNDVAFWEGFQGPSSFPLAHLGSTPRKRNADANAQF